MAQFLKQPHQTDRRRLIVFYGGKLLLPACVLFPCRRSGNGNIARQDETSSEVSILSRRGAYRPGSAIWFVLVQEIPQPASLDLLLLTGVKQPQVFLLLLFYYWLLQHSSQGLEIL